MTNTYRTRKKVIYSALVGAYDEIQQPKAVSSQFDYILFTDTVKEQNVGVWQVRAIPYENADNTRRARWVKTHPHLLLPDYDYCVWMDANVRIASEEVYQHFDDLYDSGTLIASFAHPERNCIYEEALAVIQGNRDVIDRILSEILFLKTLYSIHRSFIFSYLGPRRRDMEKGLIDSQAACRHFAQQLTHAQSLISMLEDNRMLLTVKRRKYLRSIRLLIAVIIVLVFVIILLWL